MIALLFPLAALLGQDVQPAQTTDLDPIPPTPYDAVVELEITADDPILIDGKGPTVVYEYEVEFEGTLHVWAESEADLFLRVENIEDGSVLAQDDNSGGGDVPYLKLTVVEGLFLPVLIAGPQGVAPAVTKLHLIAAPETKETRAAVAALREGMTEAAALRDIGELEAARSLIEALVAESMAVPGADHNELIAQDLSIMGLLAREVGNLESVLALEEYIHAVWERLLPAEHPDLVKVKLNLARTRTQLGDLEGALSLSEHAHETWERLLPPEHPDLLAAKLILGNARMRLRDLEGAMELLSQVHAVREKSLPSDHPDLLAAKHNLALLRYELGDLTEALEIFEHVHATMERLLPAEHPDLLSSKQSLAAMRMEVGDLPRALELFEYVHTVMERLLPPDHPDLLATKGNLAGVRGALGDMEGALTLEEYVHTTWERLLPADHHDLIGIKLSLAATRKQMGDLEGALALEEYVHATRERLFPADHPDLLKAKGNLAATRQALGDFEGARALGEHVHAAFERLLSKDHGDLLTAKQNLALTLKQLGDIRGALVLEEYVYAARERLFPTEHPELLAAKLNLAVTLEMLGDVDRALALEEQVHAVCEQLLPADHPLRLAAQQGLISTRQRIGDSKGSLDVTRSVLRGQLELAARLRLEAPRVARASALRELHRLSDVLLFNEPRIREGNVELVSELFGTLEGLRQISVGGPGVTNLPSSLSLIGIQIGGTRRRLNDLCVSPPDKIEDLPGWREELRALSDERDRLEGALRKELADAGLLAPIPDVKSVAKDLPADSALISFFRYKRQFESDATAKEKSVAVDSLLAFVVQGDGTATQVDLGPSRELEELALVWRSQIGRPLGRASEAANSRGVGAIKAASADGDRKAGVELRERLVDPCLEALGDKPSAGFYLILDDFLYLLPVSALPMDDGRVLGEVFDIHLEVSTARLLAGKPARGAKGTLIAFGGVDYDAADAQTPELDLVVATPPTGSSYRSTSSMHFGALANTGPEAAAVAGIYGDSSEEEPILLQGTAASKAALHELAPKARYLHIATHGWFAPETFKSMIDSAEEEAEREMFLRADQTLRGFAPETLCGLALAGANHGANELGKVPGIITAEELATLDLSNCELAVLSACETNVGIRRAGQGIQSLQAALHAAGARTAITSLWRVDDAATRRLMEIFYTKLWKDGLGKADALWQAKMALRDEGHPVGDWAGWVLTGDPE